VSLWGDQYDRTDGELLALQEDIARAVTTAIAGRLLPAERASLAVRPTRSREAYDHFLRGNYYLAQGTQRALARSIDEYETAARLDPTFGNAVARIGLAYWQHAMWGWNPAGMPAESIHARALAAADHAIELDSTSSDAWTVRGVVLAWHDHRYSEARRAFERALALDRRNADTYEQYGSVLRFLGEDSAAVAALRSAIALEPERPFTLLILSDVSKVHRRIDESRRLLDSAIALAPGFSYAYAMRALDELWLGDTAPARRDAETAIRFAPPTYTGGAVALALVDLHAGDTTGVRARVERLLQAAPAPDSLRGFNTMFVSMALAALGERDRALGVLKSARDFALFWFWLRWPQFDPIRADPRFQRLVEESRPR
jgi:tetratricopeptide (TPR) repeat protein